MAASLVPSSLAEDFLATALRLCAALVQERDLRAVVQNNQAAVIAKVAAGRPCDKSA